MQDWIFPLDYIPCDSQGFNTIRFSPLGDPEASQKACFMERIEAPPPPLRPRPKCNFIHPRQLSPFLSVWYCRLKKEVILSGYEDIVSSRTDLVSAWVKMDPHDVLVEHMVDIEKATAEFRVASERKHATSSLMNSSSKQYASRSIVQNLLSIYNWNPGPRRGK